MLAPSGGGERGLPPPSSRSPSELFGHYSVGLSNRQSYAGQLSERVCGRQRGRGRSRGRGSHQQSQVVEGKGEVKAANEGREMTAIQPLLPCNLKQCVMELSSSSSSSVSYLPLSFFPLPGSKMSAAAASSHVYVIDNCIHLESSEGATAAAATVALFPISSDHLAGT